MAATVQAVGTGHETSPTPPAHAANDWLYLFVECSSGTVATPSGWTAVPGFPTVMGSTSTFAFRFLAVSGATANPALSGGTDHMWGTIVNVRGAHLTTPHFAMAGIGQAGTTTPQFPGLTFSTGPVDDALVLMIGSWNLDSAGPLASLFLNTSLTSITEIYDAGTTTANGGGLFIASGVLAAGTTTIAAGSCTLGSSSGTATATLVIRAAPAAPAFTVAGTWTIAGAPAPDGATIEVWDRTLGVLETTGSVSGGAGAFSIAVLYDDHTYRVVGDSGDSYSASPLDTAS